MDILNFISWIKGGRVVTSVDPAKTLLPVGLKDNRRDDKYLAGAISVQDLAAQIAPQPAYKVYTALLTQNGASDEFRKDTGLLIIGITYYINYNSPGMDFTNVGAPNNNLGTYFVATGTTPNSWGGDEASGPILLYNTGAPIVTVLENTIGNIWFTYSNIGIYKLHNSTLTNESKLYFNIQSQEISSLGCGWNDEDGSGAFILSSIITDIGTVRSNDFLYNTSFEIRVYN